METKIVMAHGCFDVLHYGHMLHLEQAKSMGSMLIVSVTSDAFVNKPGRPIFTTRQRMEMLESLRFVNTAVLSECITAEQSILRYRPHIFVKGCDYDLSGMHEDELRACRAVGAEIRFTDTEKFSTTGILERLKCAS